MGLLPKMRLTVIIPVYKTPRVSLERCLRSVISLRGDMEIVCILDSPGDPCGEILNEFACQDNRVHVIENDVNRGVSFSRNRGLDVAKGDIVAFVDSDDEIVPAVYEEGLERMAAHGLDMCVCMSPNNESWHGVRNSDFVETVFPNGDEFTLFATVSALGQSCWGVLWKRQTIEDRRLRFSEGIKYNEDFLFSTSFINGGGRFGLLNKQGYRRIGCEMSVTRKGGSPDLTLNRLDAQCEMLSCVRFESLSERLHAWYAQNFLGNVFGNRHVARMFPYGTRDAYDIRLKKFIDLFYAKGLTRFCSFPARIFLGILKRNPTLLLKNYWLIALPFGILLKYKWLMRG